MGAWEVVVIVAGKEEELAGVTLDDGPADELRRSTGCTAELRENRWLKWFMCLSVLKGEARERATKERKMSGKCTSIAGDTMSETSVRK